MKKTVKIEANVGPGTIEEIVIQGLKDRNLIAKETSGVVMYFYYKDFWGKQKRVFVNQVKVSFNTYEN